MFIMPRTGFISPFKASPPANMELCMFCGKICLETPKIAIEIGKSSQIPDFSRSEGARFTTIFCAGKSSCELLIAERILSLLSLIDLLGIPTILNRGRPLLESASIVISWLS